MTTTTTKTAVRAHRAHVLRLTRAIRRARREAYDAERADRSTNPNPHPAPDYATPWRDRTPEQRAAYIAHSDHESAQWGSFQGPRKALEKELADARAAFRAERAHLIRPADPLHPNAAFSLSGATSGACELETYCEDAGSPLWLLLDEFGAWLVPIAIIQAPTWETAYEVAEDEFFDDADDDAQAEAEENPHDMPEGTTWRSNGIPSGNRPERQTMLARTEGYHLERVTRETVATHSLAFSFTL